MLDGGLFPKLIAGRDIQRACRAAKRDSLAVLGTVRQGNLFTMAE